MTARRRLLLIASIAVLLSPLLLLLLPRARAAARLLPGFEPLPADDRVWCEPGAEAFAARLAEALPEAIRRVEAVQPLAFEPGFRVYVAATHERFTRFIGEDPKTAVRGIALPWDVWVSPLAFDFFGTDTHRQALAHELSHLHLKQHAGRVGGRRNLPTWFCEGLADLAAGMGFDRVSRGAALAALAAGRHFRPMTTGGFLLPDAGELGVSWPMLHAQSRLFLDYLAGKAPGALERHLLALYGGEDFGTSFERQYGESLEAAWAGFLASVREMPLPAGEGAGA